MNRAAVEFRFLMFYSFVLLGGMLFLASCASSPYKAANTSYKQQAKAFSKTILATPVSTPGADSIPVSKDWVGTVNFNLRKPNYVILHHTAQNSTDQTLKTFTTVATQVSAHYLVGRDGSVHHMLNDYMRSWHAGVAKWGNETDLNSSSIGIEIDNNGTEPFSEAQIASLIKLLGALKKTYNIPAANFIGHADVAPGRKVDPSALFPWKRLAEKGFGLWYDEVLELPPPTFDPAMALRIVGYNTQDLPLAIGAFKLHFIQTDLSPALTQLDLNVLYNLYRKY